MSDARYDEACHFVFDIETLGIKDDAAIIEIGLVVVEPDENKRLKKTWSWHGSIDIDTQQNHNVGNIELDTLKWWISKGDVLKEIYTISPTNQIYTFEYSIDCIRKIVDKFRDQYKDKVYFWSRGTDFDYRILNSHIQAICENKESPWKFWELRDIRTIANPMIMNASKRDNPHRALQDAINEADDLIDAITALANPHQVSE